MKTKNKKISSSFYITLIALSSLALSCTKSSDHTSPPNTNVSKTQEPSPNIIIPKIKSEDWRLLESFLLNSSIPTEGKVSVVRNYIKVIADKYQMTESQVKNDMIQAFDLPTDSQLLAQMGSVEQEVRQLRNRSADYLGIPSISTQAPDGIRFIANDSEVQNLRQGDFLEKMRLDLLRHQAQEQTYMVFKAFADQADQYAFDLLVYFAQSERDDLFNKISYLSKLEKSQAHIASLQYGAHMVNKIQNLNQSEKIAMLGFVVEQIDKAASNPAEFENAIRIKITDEKIKTAAGNLAKIACVLTKFSNDKREQLVHVQEQLSNFAKNGEMKIDLTTLTGDPNFQAKVSSFGQKYAEYVDGGKELISVAKQFGVDPNVVNNVEKGVDFAEKGLKLVNAISSSNPIAIVSAVSSALNIGSLESYQDNQQRIMQSKMDMMISLQTRTLDELEKTREDIRQIGSAVAKTQMLIGNLSLQISDTSQKIFNELRLVHNDVEQVRDMVQADLRDGLSNCMMVEIHAQNNSPVDLALKPTRGMESNLTQCLMTIANTHFSTQESLEKFRTYQTNLTDDTLERTVQLSKISIPLNPIFLNPVSSFYQFDKFFYQSVRMPSNGDFILNKTLYTVPVRFKLLDSSYLAAMVTSIVTIAPDLSIFNVARGSSVVDLVKVDPKDTGHFIEIVEELFNIVNANIVQTTSMAGIFSFQSNPKDVELTNTNPETNCQPHVNLDSLSCLLRNDEYARKNYLKYELNKELIQKGKSATDYAFWARRVDSDNEVDHLNNLLSILLDVFSKHWDLKVEFINNKKEITANVAGIRTILPTSEEMNSGDILYRPELKYLLVVRENLLDLYTDLKQNTIENESVRRLLMAQVLKKSLN